ncbi:MAG: hypothetical protein AAGJ87_15920 [Pseudomonadota bacterium]
METDSTRTSVHDVIQRAGHGRLNRCEIAFSDVERTARHVFYVQIAVERATMEINPTLEIRSFEIYVADDIAVLDDIPPRAAADVAQRIGKIIANNQRPLRLVFSAHAVRRTLELARQLISGVLKNCLQDPQTLFFFIFC